ncbi:DUF551 domain-containing protein [Escherichia coli]|uniref:DUF551 domain-containing protein n=1 Tax=Escherichia coli TaxID=562 RepID=UPI00351D904A
MTTITKERLLTIKQWRETYGPGSNVVLPAEEAEELARIALASLEAEPVAWTDEEELRAARQYGLGEIFQYPPDKYADSRRVIPLYRVPPAVPQLPQPAVPGEIQKLKDGRGFKYVKDGVRYSVNYANGWNACRAAMLQGSQPVSQAYKLSALDGNAPVTPDGWISCSERMPDDGQHVIILCDSAFVLYAQYRGGEFFDVVRNGEEFFETQSRNVTHWMPLPEPPQEVNRG